MGRNGHKDVGQTKLVASLPVLDAPRRNPATIGKGHLESGRRAPSTVASGDESPMNPDGAIHRSAWKGNSANFALTEFSEGRMYGVLGS